MLSLYYNKDTIIYVYVFVNVTMLILKFEVYLKYLRS